MTRQKTLALLRRSDDSTELTGVDGGAEQGAVEQITDFVRVEKNIITLGFFTPTSKGSTSKLKVTRVKTIHITEVGEDGRPVQTTVKINTGGDYGLPGTRDLDMWLAFMKLVNGIQKRDGVVTNPVCFSSWELFNLLGYRSESQNNFDAITEWLNRMFATTIECRVEGGKREKGISESTGIRNLSVFQDRVSKGDRLPNGGGIADSNYVWLSKWQLENLNNNLVIPVDFETYRRIRRPIARTLVPLLQVYLYATRDKNVFEKSYDALCQLLGVKRWKYVGDIKDQLAPSLNELKECEYLAGWGIEPMRGVEGFKVVFRHGPKFHRDRALLVGRQGELPAGAAEGVGEEDARLIELLKGQGIAEAKARLLVTSRAEGQHIEDQVEWMQELIRRRGVENFPNPAGYLIRLIEVNAPVPPHFETSRKRRAREEAEGAARTARDRRQLLEYKYEEYVSAAVAEHVRRLPATRRRQLEKDKLAEFNVRYKVAARLYTEENKMSVVTKMIEDEIKPEVQTLGFEEFAARFGEGGA